MNGLSKCLLILIFLFPGFSDGSELLRQAETFYANKDYQSCIQAAEEVLKADSCSAQAHTLIGKSFGILRQLDLAQRHFATAISCDSLFAEAYYGLGTVAFFQNNYEAAAKGLERAIDLGLHMPGVYRNLSGIYAKQQRWALAREIGERGLEIDPDNAQIKINLVATYNGLKLYRKAIELLENALKNRPEDIQNRIVLAELNLKAGFFEQALAILNQVEENRQAVRRKGETIFFLEQFENALPYLKQSIYIDQLGNKRQHPDKDTLLMIAETFYEIGQVDSSKFYFNMLKKNATTNTDIDYATHALENLNQDKRGERLFVSQVPFYAQGRGVTCLKASVLSVMRYWDGAENQAEDWLTLEDRLEDNLSALYALSEAFPELSIHYLNWDLEQIEESLKSGCPPVALIADQDPDLSHTVIVVGIDYQRDVIIVNDPSIHKLHKLPLADFQEYWKRGRNGIFLVLPKQREQDISLVPNNRANPLSLLLAGYGRFKSEQFVAASNYFDRFLKLDTPYFLKILLADVYIRMGKLTKAEQVIQQAIQQRGDDPVGWMSLARIADRKYKYKKAKELSQKAINLADGKYQTAHLVLALSYFSDGDKKSAREYLNKAITLFPNGGAKNYMIYYWLGIVQFSIGEVSESLESFRKSVELRGGYAPAWTAIKLVSEVNGKRIEKAEADKLLSRLMNAQ